MSTDPDWRFLIQSYGYNLMEDDDKNFIAYRLNEEISSNSLKDLAEIIAMKHEHNKKNTTIRKPVPSISKIILTERKIQMLKYFQYELVSDKNQYVKNGRSVSVDVLNKLTESRMFDYLFDQDKLFSKK